MFGAILKVLPAVLPVALQLVGQVEKLFGAGRGDEKRSVVVMLVKSLILAYEGLKKEDLLDEDLFSEGVGNIVDGIVAVLNSFKKEE